MFFSLPLKHISIYDDQMRADLPRTRYLIWRESQMKSGG